MAADFNVQLDSVAQLTIDDDGRPLGYPTDVFYDPTEEEIYLVNGGSGRVVVYGPDFFPRISIGVGRGVGAPRGGAVMANGKVFISQGRTKKSPARRITILNGAFFVDRDINLDEIPEAGDFTPKKVAMSRDGFIYVAGDNNRGVLVLDGEGIFQRWLKPMDVIRDRQAIEEAAQQPDGKGQPTEEEQLPPDEAEEKILEEEGRQPDIPEEFRPRSGRNGERVGPMEGLGPVKVNYVTIDSAGNLYLLSAETSKVYVYGPDESFLFAFGQKGGSPRQMSQPRALAIDEERGQIYVVDYMRHTILVYDLAGRFLFEFGGRGLAPGWFNFPCGIAINRHGQVIIADQFNKRVQVLEVEFLGMFGMSKGGQPAATSPETPGGAEPTAPDEPLPGQPDAGTEEQLAPDEDLPVQEDVGIEDVVIPVVEIPGYSDAATDGQGAQGEGSQGQPDAGDAQKLTPEAPPEQTDGGAGVKVLKE